MRLIDRPWMTWVIIMFAVGSQAVVMWLVIAMVP
jgi:hypothetical protein